MCSRSEAVVSTEATYQIPVSVIVISQFILSHELVINLIGVDSRLGIGTQLTPDRPNPVLFLATLSFMASHLDALHRRHSSPSTLAYKVQCIRLVNARLRFATETLIDTTTLGAVAMPAAQEVCSARRPWNMNLHGLRLTLI